MSKRYVLPILIIFLAVTFVPCSFAQDAAKEKPWKRFAVNLGANFVNSNSDIRLGTKGASLSVDVEELLGLDTNTTAAKIDGFWRFTKSRRHRLDFSWFSTRRSGENTVGITDPIDIGDNITINPGAHVKTELNVDIYQVGYSYSFFQDERLDLASAPGRLSCLSASI